MPAPLVATYSTAALVAAHTAFKNLIDAGAGPGTIKIRNAADSLMATITLADPCGTVNGTTGQLVFGIAAREESADISGTAAYGEFCDSAGLVHLSLPAAQGNAPASGYIVLNTLGIVSGSPVEVASATVG